MKLVLDATNIAPGGGLVVLGNILREWQKQGQPIDVSIFISRSEVGEIFSAYRPDMTIHPFMVGSGPTKVYIGRKFELGKQIEKLRPDVLLAIGSMTGNCSVPQHVHHQNLRWLMDWPLIETLRSHGMKKTLRWRRQHRESIFTIKNARCNTFISDYMRQIACRLVPESAPRNFTISNAPGVPIKRDVFNSSPLPLIAAIQNADYYKDAPTLLRVLAECVRRRPDVDWRMKIIGGGNWEYALDLAEKLQICDRIIFMGHSSSSQIVELLDEAFCLLFPSRCEGFGIPPLEAMARGCAVVSSNADALPEVIGNGGILVKPEDIDGFSDSVIRLWDDASQRRMLVEAGYSQVEKFSWAKSAATLAELLMNGQRLYTGS